MNWVGYYFWVGGGWFRWVCLWLIGKKSGKGNYGSEGFLAKL
jgi:hypothetical protein